MTAKLLRLLLQNRISLVQNLIVHPKCLYKPIELHLVCYCGVLRDINIKRLCSRMQCEHSGLKITFDLWLLFVLLLSIRNEPGKRHPHAAVGRPLLVQGRCTCPSCHRWLSQSQSFPERREDSRCGETLTWHTNTVHTVRQRRSHLSVYVAISVNVVKVKRPLQLFSQCSSQQYRQTRYKVLAAMGQKTKSDFKKNHSTWT